MNFNYRKSPIGKNISANLFGIGVQLLNQILLVPLFLYYWNNDLYGDWIVISAISSFFSMSDMGLNSVTANQLTMSYAAGNKDECRTLLTNNYLIVIFVAVIALIGSLVYVFGFDIVTSLGLHAFSRRLASYVFVVLILQIFLGMFSSVLDSIYRANSMFHKSQYLNNTGRLLESLVILVSLVLKLNIALMVSLYLLPRIFVFIYKKFDTQKLMAYHFRFRDKNWELLKRILFPSLTFMSFPAGNAIVYQGFTLVVNKFFGADSVVLYSTTRVLASFIRQLLSTMQQAVWPEYSIAYGKNNINRMKNLHRKAFSIAMLGGVVLYSGLLIFGPLVYEIWTHGKIVFSFSLMLAFVVVMMTENTWSTSSVCLMATNKHSRIGIAYVVMAAVSISVSIVICQFYQNLPITVYCLLLIHIPLSVYAVRKGMEMTEDTLGGFLKSISLRYLLK